MSNDHRPILQRGLYAGEHRARVNAAAAFPRSAAGSETAAFPGRNYFSRMSFLTDVTPLTPRAISTALVISARELTKPLNCTVLDRKEKGPGTGLPFRARCCSCSSS